MPAGVIVSLIGSLEDVSFPDILQVIHLSRQTGTLVLIDAQGERRVRFRNGLVCGATLGEGGPELEDLLVSRGLVSPAALPPARARMAQSGEPLAGALIALGAVSQATVERVVGDEIRSTIRDLVLLQQGDFRFDLDCGPQPEPAGIRLQDGLDPGSLLDGLSTPQPFAAVEAWNDAAMMPSGGASRVLLVTDRTTLRAALRDHLTRQGCEVVEASGATSALEAAAALIPKGAGFSLVCDLILPDGRDHPGHGGLDLVREMRELRPDLKAVIFGELRESGPAVATGTVGALAYLPLPQPSEEGRQAEGEALRRFCATLRAILRGDEAASCSGQRERRDSIRVVDSLSLLRGLISELQTEGETEIPLLILRLAVEYFERGVLFSVQGSGACCTGAFGPDAQGAGGLEQRIRGAVLAFVPDSALETVVRTRRGLVGPLEPIAANQPLLDTLGSPIPAEVSILPLASGRDVVGLLYGDNAASRRPIGDLQGLEIFLSQAGIALQNGLLKRHLASIGADRESGAFGGMKVPT